MFNAQPAMAAQVTYEYSYPYTVDIPSPLDVAKQIPELSEFLEANGEDSLCYAVFDYGDSLGNYTAETYKDVSASYPDYRFYNWYYVYSESGSAVKPQQRYFYVFFPYTLYNSGDALTGSEKFTYGRNGSIGVSNPGVYLRIEGSPVCGVWYNPDTHGISVDKNTFSSYSTSDDSTYLIRFTRNANSTVKYYDTNTYKYLDTLYPCLIGIKDNSFDVTTLYQQHVEFQLSDGAYSVVNLSVPTSYISDLSLYTFTFEFGNDMNSILLNVGNMISGIFGFMSDVVILLSENTVILILLCIPLVGLAIGLFKSFTSR